MWFLCDDITANITAVYDPNCIAVSSTKEASTKYYDPVHDLVGRLLSYQDAASYDELAIFIQFMVHW